MFLVASPDLDVIDRATLAAAVQEPRERLGSTRGGAHRIEMPSAQRPDADLAVALA